MNIYFRIILISTVCALVPEFFTSCEKKQKESVPTKQEIIERFSTEVSTPEEAIKLIKNGNTRFVTGSNVFPHHNHTRVVETATKQNPFAAIIGCSDSRVPIELIFDQGIGDLFVIRTAGNSLNDNLVMGSVDYAIYHLGVKLVIVLGHESCGGVTNAILPPENEKPQKLERDRYDDGKVQYVLDAIREDVKQYIGKPDSLEVAIHANAAAQVKRIKSFPHIQQLIKEGKLQVLKAYYNLHSGTVTFF